MSHDIMIDLETLGTTPDAVILSIGAVRFDLHAGLIFDAHEDDLFYRAVRIDSQPDRKISGDTIAWWMAQTKEAQTVFTEPRGGLFNALVDLHHWIDATPGTTPHIWSNGADFDLPILNHAFGQNTLPLPWKPYAGRCYRTYKNLPGARNITVQRKGEHHNALDDAIHQARHLCLIHALLFAQPSLEVPTC